MSDTVSRKALIDCLKKEVELCIKEKFNENKTRFYLGRETALTDIIRQIESERFDIPSDHEAENESLKAITELAVKGLTDCYISNGYKFVKDILDEIERLSHDQNSQI